MTSHNDAFYLDNVRHVEEDHEEVGPDKIVWHTEQEAPLKVAVLTNILQIYHERINFLCLFSISEWAFLIQALDLFPCGAWKNIFRIYVG
jgi:hypothetical protein